EARFLFTVPAILDRAKDAAARAGIEEIFVIGAAGGFRSLAHLLEAPPSPPVVDIDPERDLVVLPYSSGTTGLPKGVMLTHYNLVANLLQSACVIGLTERDTVIGVLPFFHIYGMVVIMNLSLHVGATVVTMP